MTQIVNRTQFLKELENVKKGLANKDLIEQSTSFIFNNKKVITYNDEIFAMIKSSLDIDGAVDADTLIKLLNKANDEELKIDLNENELLIKGKKFSSGLTFDNEIKTPIDDVNVPKRMYSLPNNFTEQAKLACLTASSNLSEPLLTCVHIYENIIESCDNDRITVCTLENEFDFDILVPAKNLLEICKEKLIQVNVDDSWIHFKTEDGTLLSTRLYNENYPDVQQFIPEEYGKTLPFPKEISEILNRANIFSKDAMTQEKMITINIKNKKLEITARNQQGWFKERAKIDFDTNISFSINEEFLKYIMELTDKISFVGNMLFFETENSTHLILLEDNENE